MPYDTCPCCGYRTIRESVDICDVCWWEHDPQQQADPDSTVGANSRLSLRVAQRNFALFGACAPEEADLARRPGPDDVRDPNWKPLEQRDEE